MRLPIRKIGYYSLFILGFFAVRGTCQERKPTATPAPQTKVSIQVTPSNYDWGEVGPGTLKTLMQVKNIGNDSLLIEKISASCGTLKAHAGKLSLGPEDTTTLQLTLYADELSGQVTNEVFLYLKSNDSVIIAPIQAEIVRNITTRIEEADDLRALKVEVPVKAIIEIDNNGPNPLILGNATVDCPSALIVPQDLDGRIIEPGQINWFSVEIIPTKKGYAVGLLTIPTSDQKIPVLRIPIQLKVS